jgi:hypothetical protein
MNANLRMLVGSEGCFSSGFLDYTIILNHKSSSIIAHVIIGREPEFLGIEKIQYSDATDFISEIVKSFRKKETLFGERSTTYYEAEVSWDYSSKRETHYIKTCDMPIEEYMSIRDRVMESENDELKKVLENPDLYFNRYHFIHKKSVNLMTKLFPTKSELLKRI